MTVSFLADDEAFLSLRGQDSPWSLGSSPGTQAWLYAGFPQLSSQCYILCKRLSPQILKAWVTLAPWSWQFSQAQQWVCVAVHELSIHQDNHPSYIKRCANKEFTLYQDSPIVLWRYSKCPLIQMAYLDLVSHQQVDTIKWWYSAIHTHFRVEDKMWSIWKL